MNYGRQLKSPARAAACKKINLLTSEEDVQSRRIRTPASHPGTRT
jgi:hypothetical protein